MNGIKFVTFTKEYKGEERDFNATIGAALRMDASMSGPGKAFGVVSDMRKLDDKRVEVKMTPNSVSPWGSNTLEATYTSIG